MFPRIGFGKRRRTILGYVRGRPIRDLKRKAGPSAALGMTVVEGGRSGKRRVACGLELFFGGVVE